MIAIVKNNLEKIIATCRKMHVKSLYLIGSGARGDDFKNDSDLDFVFQFEKNSEGLHKAVYDYFDLLFTLEEITGRKIDLIAEEKILNKYFLERINNEKVSIYES